MPERYRVIHRYQGFETLEEAKAFGRGVLLTPRDGERSVEYRVLAADYIDVKTYPFIRVWNEREYC